MKRVYSAVAVVPAEDGHAVAVDGRPLRTPAGRALVVAALPLAEAIAAEWAAQGDSVRPETMPLTQLASTALDRVGPERAAILDQLVAYGGSDLLCYRAEQPEDLVERQERVWQPLVDWASVALGAELLVTAGVVPVPQPEPSLATLRRRIEGYDLPRLTALQSAVAASGSLLLGLALVEGRLGAEEVFAASQLDELYQEELWGEDSEAATRRLALRDDILAAARFLALSAVLKDSAQIKP